MNLSIISTKYCDTDQISIGERATVHFYVNEEKRQIIAKLYDDNFVNAVNAIVNLNFIPKHKLLGFLKSYHFLDNPYLETSVTAVPADDFNIEEGKRRALAKILVKREICLKNLQELLTNNMEKRFFNVKFKLLNKYMCEELYEEYYENFLQKRNNKSIETKLNKVTN